MSNSPEYQRLDKVWPLGEKEVDIFVGENVWPAAEYHWGVDFYDPEKLDYIEDIIIDPANDDPELAGKLELFLRLIDDTDYPLDDLGERITEGITLDIMVGLYMEGYRDDMTERFQNKYDTELSVWEVVEYDFPLNGGTPVVDRYYSLRTPDGDDVDKPRRQQKNFLKNMARSSKYGLPQRRNITFQDCIDIHNILLAMGVPPERIVLPSMAESDNPQIPDQPG